MSVRGGPEDANKVLIDGVPINDIGGVADFSYLQAVVYDQSNFSAARTALSTAPMHWPV